MAGPRIQVTRFQSAVALAPLLACAAALAQSSGAPDSSPRGSQAGPRYDDTSAQAGRAGALPANPTKERATVPDIRPRLGVLVPVATNTQDASIVARSLQVRAIDLRAPMRFDRVFALRSAAPADLHGGSLLSFGGSSIIASSVPLDTTGTEWFARVDGGLMALFPKSVYDRTENGLEARVPAGTIFVIGHPPARFMDALVPSPPRQEPLPAEFVPIRPTAGRAVRSADRSLYAAAKSADPKHTKESSGGSSGAGSPAVQADPRSVDAARAGASGRGAGHTEGTILGDEAYRTRRVRGLLLKAAASPPKTPAGEAVGGSDAR